MGPLTPVVTLLFVLRGGEEEEGVEEVASNWLVDVTFDGLERTGVARQGSDRLVIIAEAGVRDGTARLVLASADTVAGGGVAVAVDGVPYCCLMSLAISTLLRPTAFSPGVSTVIPVLAVPSLVLGSSEGKESMGTASVDASRSRCVGALSLAAAMERLHSLATAEAGVILLVVGGAAAPAEADVGVSLPLLRSSPRNQAPAGPE